MTAERQKSTPPTGEWTFLSNHAHVLICIHRNPDIRTRDIAEAVGITERATQGIVADLVAAGYLLRERQGRRNVYTVLADTPFRHPLEAHRSVGELLAVLEETAPTRGKKR